MTAAAGNEVESSDGVSADFATTTSFSAAATASDSAASRLLLHPNRLAVKEEDGSSHQVWKLARCIEAKD